MPRTRRLAGAILAGLLFSTAAAATDFSQVVVFGDSLSDAGNLSLSQGSPVPLRFTTNPGTTTAENVATSLGFTLAPSVAGGTDFAFGGAGVVRGVAPVPTLPQQMAMYLGASGGTADPNALYQVWGGANDIFYLTGTSTDTNVLAAGTANAALTEVNMLGQLQAAGARYVVVYNLPDVGKTPASAAGGPAAQAGGTQLSVVYNGVLHAGIAQLSANGLNVIPVNTFALLNEVIANPSAYGFDNVTTPACTGSSVQCGPAGAGLPFSYAAGTDQTYLFADGVHPTTAAHAMLAQYVVSEIMAPGQMSLLGEAPLAATAAQYRAIRNEMLADGQGRDTRVFASVDYGRQRFDATGGSPRTDSDNVNLTLGADVRASEHVSLGVALGLGQHDADFAGGMGGYKMTDISGLGYATYHNGGGYVGGFASFGQSNFTDINRRIQLGQALRTEGGKADGTHLGGGLEGGWWFGTDGLKTGPFAHVEWQTVKVDGFTEGSSDSTAMWFGSQQRDALIETLGWRLQGQWQAGGAMLMPFVELAWNHDDKADPHAVEAGLVSMPGSFALTGYEPDRSWASADVGLSAQFSSSVTGWFGYHGRFSDDNQKDDSLNLGVKIGF
ncbi:autotransporter domain-containing protein [Frateuria hangzhouensis]|uniref:autotransporter domain-containing protein n=1 Tax=Frateuria hangzhouensis TaxID=2995589 RepID=UPI002260E8CA|nr:autotransporter domain-containing protein [Frateuria sp. STR12]MCX7512518.1 autotransporter domain-containing protein [Frateuria sp. STR12]